MKKRLLLFVTSIVLLAVMGITLSAHAFADGRKQVGGGPMSGEGLAGSKYVYVNEDGSYDVELETFGSGEVSVTTKVKPSDIVLVLDVSGSMAYNFSDENPVPKINGLVDAVNSFLKTVSDTNEEAVEKGAEEKDLSKVAIVTYTGDWEYDWFGRPTNFVPDIDTVYNFTTIRSSNLNSNSVYTGRHGILQGHELVANGATPTELGLERADDLLESLTGNTNYDKEERNRVVVLFTDGEPTHQSSLELSVAKDAINNANHIKQTYDATVYSVAVLEGASPANDPERSYGAWGASYAGGVTTSDAQGANHRKATTNIFLHAVSSNYPNASAATATAGSYWDRYTVLKTTWGDGGAYTNGYYMAATNADDLKKIFDKISSATGTSGTELGTEAVMKDIVASSFSLPDGVTSDDIRVKVVPWDSNTHAWSTSNITKEDWETATGEEIKVTIDGKTVDITGFDYKKHTLFTTDPEIDTVGGVNKDSAKIVVTFTMYAEPASITGSSVETNGAGSGLYENENAEKAVIEFPRPQVTFTPISFVIDYAKPTDLDYSQVLDTVVRIDDPTDHYLHGLKAVPDDEYQRIPEADKHNYFDFDEVHETNYGYVAFHNVFAENADHSDEYVYDKTGFKVTYLPKTMDWDDYDRIFVMGRPLGGSGDVWSFFTVMPANNVYYEDTFAGSYIYYNEHGHDALHNVEIKVNGINYDKDAWSEDGTEEHREEDATGSVQGWIDLLENETEYTGLSAHYTSTSGAKASFTFSGTGVDVYSRTNGTTGTIAVMLQGTTASGTKVSQGKVIDNKAASGDYYGIPTCSFNGLEYGRYTVTLIVTKAAESEGRLTYYLDGIRIYNPIKPHESQENVIAAYGPENLNAVFTDVRSILLNDGDFSGKATGAVYIDELTDGDGNTTTDMSVYEKEGPKSELYLNPGQGVAISVTADHSYFVGLKAINGVETTLKINDTELTIKHTADMYYRAVPVDADGGKVITITNESGGILSVTKLRTTDLPEVTPEPEPEPGNGTNGVKFVSAESLLEAYRQVSEMPVVPFDFGEEEKEVTEEFNAEEIVIENPEPEVNEETDSEPVSEETVEVEAPVNNPWANLLALIGGFRAILRP